MNFKNSFVDSFNFRQSAEKKLCKTCKISLFQFFFLSYFCSILCPNYQIFITRMYCGKVMFSVLSVILFKGSPHVCTPLKPSPDHVGTPGPLSCSKLVHFVNPREYRATMGRALIGCCHWATANQSSPHRGPSSFCR